MKTLLVLIILLLFNSCIVYYSIGETEQDFTAKNRGVGLMLEETTYNYSVYSCCGGVYNQTFYYFYDGRLERIDHGESRADLIIEHK